MFVEHAVPVWFELWLVLILGECGGRVRPSTELSFANAFIF